MSATAPAAAATKATHAKKHSKSHAKKTHAAVPAGETTK
jgi:hypothetical protein